MRIWTVSVISPERTCVLGVYSNLELAREEVSSQEGMPAELLLFSSDITEKDAEQFDVYTYTRDQTVYTVEEHECRTA